MSALISCTKNVYFGSPPPCLRAKITETFGEICFISDTQYLTSFTVFSIGVLQMIIMSWKREKISSYDYFCSILEFQVPLAKNPRYKGNRHNIADNPKSIPSHIQLPSSVSSIYKIQTFLWACYSLSL
jgi:hypothetical protein